MSKRLGELLIASSYISEDELQNALVIQEEDSRLFGEILIGMGACSEEQVLDALALQLSMPRVANIVEHLGVATIDDLSFNPLELDPQWWKQQNAFPLSSTESALWVALEDIFNSFVISALEKVSGKEVIPVLCSGFELRKLHGLIEETQADGGAFSSDEMNDSSAPVVKFVNDIIQRAMTSKASDIHFEIYKGVFRVRFRIDGVLQEVDQPGLQMHAAVVSRLKLMATLDISEKRLPQDGRIRLRLGGQAIDIRMATTPTVHGENIVLRLLASANTKAAVKKLEMFPDQLAELQDLTKLKNGIFLVTGPTGSGKTTSLYTILEQLNTEETKIITVEDPVEIQVSGLTQIQVQSEIGLHFSTVLRSALRQDPDIMLIGEMRDKETAQIAVQAALTGHLVLSTLHTNDAPSSFIRLKDMGIPDYLIKSSVEGIMAQRLLRRLCSRCCSADNENLSIAMSAGLAVAMEKWPNLVQKVDLHKPVGCSYCSGTGYQGRLAVFELLTMQNDSAMLGEFELENLQALVDKRNMRTLKEDGLLRAAQGLTSLDEVLRVLG